jgi:DNA-binding IclR family transcriptional regulator
VSQVLGRALDILEHLAKEPATLAELSLAFDVHKTTIMRLLHALEERHYVVKHPDERYQLGHGVYALASAAAASGRGIQSAAHPHLVRLNMDIGHTVHLAALENDEVVYIDKIEPRTPVRMYSRVGLSASLNSAAVAKILAGSLDRPDRERLLGRADLTERTPHTLTTPEQVLDAWDEASRRHWAADREEHERLVHCVAVPIYGADGTVWAAISVTVPTVILDFEQLKAMLPRLHETACAISADLGFRGEVPAPDLAERAAH